MSELTAVSNSQDCFRVCIGRKVIGVLFDALPIGTRELRAGSKTLIFEDGYGLTISSHGTFWTESADNIRRAIRERESELAAASNEHREVLKLTGLSNA
jgi:hypothetical protein